MEENFHHRKLKLYFQIYRYNIFERISVRSEHWFNNNAQKIFKKGGNISLSGNKIKFFHNSTKTNDRFKINLM